MKTLQAYYRLHSRIYDPTRWSFLFGRTALIRNAAAGAAPRRILEIGCGTGSNLVQLADRFPGAEITGVDLSRSMLEIARKKLLHRCDTITLLHCGYDRPLRTVPRFDLVLMSYVLSMINPGWDRAIACAFQDLAPGGYIAVADFHDSAFSGFKRWMQMNHVRMSGHLLPELAAVFQEKTVRIRRAYGGLWSYFLFLGEKSGKKIACQIPVKGENATGRRAGGSTITRPEGRQRGCP